MDRANYLCSSISCYSGNNKCGGALAKCNNYRTFHPEIALPLKICK